MNMKTVVAALFVVLSCTVVWLTLPGDEAGRPGMAPPAATPAAPAGPVQGELAVVQAGATQKAGDVPAATDRSQVSAALTDAAGSLPIVVRGRIVDRQGAPRRGVAVVAQTWTAVEGFEPLGPPWPRERRGEADPTATTGADGTFSLVVPHGRDGTLDLGGEELVLEGEPPSFRGSKGDRDLGDLVALRSGAMRGVVRDEAGRPIAGVLVQASAGPFDIAPRSSSVTQEDGTFHVGRLRPGTWTLRTASGSFLPSVLEVTLAPEERRDDLVLVVRAGNAIAGQVVDDRGVGVPGMKVGSRRKEVRGAIGIERFSADEAATTDAGGFFTLAGLPEGSATIRVFGPRHTRVTVPDVAVGTGNLVVRVERTAVVEGVLVDRAGGPIAGSRVAAVRADRAESGRALVLEEVDGLAFEAGGANSVTGADGAFRIEGVAPGSVVVTARGKGHLPALLAGIQAQPGQTVAGVRLVADAGATARVTVLDEEGRPVAGAGVRVERMAEPVAGGAHMAAHVAAFENENGEVALAGGTETLGAAETDEHGVATVPALPPERVTMTATHSDFAAASPVNALMPAAGTIETTLTLRRPGFVEIQAVAADGAPLAEASFRIVAADPLSGATHIGTTDAAGRARSAALVPGEYSAALVRPQAPGRFGEMFVYAGDGEGDRIAGSDQQFTVTAGGTTSIVLRRPKSTRLHGTVIGAEGPVAACVVELTRRDTTELALPGFGGRRTQTAADGSFEFTDVESGSYRLRYGRTEQIVKAWADVDVPRDIDELRQDLVFRTGRLTVRVVAKATGEPVEGAEVEIVSEADAGTAAGQARGERRITFAAISIDANGGDTMQMTVGDQRVRTDAAGFAAIDGVPVGVYAVGVRHERYAPADLKSRAVAERQTTDCGLVELDTAGRIRGNVSTADGKRAPMALVEHRAIGTDQWSGPEMAMDGSFTLTGLLPGRYVLRAQAIGPRTGESGPEIEVDVTGGETSEVELRLPPR